MIFYPKRTKRSVLFHSEPIEHIAEYPKSKDICLPVVVDTEFQSPSFEDDLNKDNRLSIQLDNQDLITRKLNYIQGKRVHITSQFRSIGQDLEDSVILASSVLESLDIGEVRHKTVNTDFHVVDWLRTQGFTASIIKRESKHRNKRFPLCEIVVYAHFALAELGMIFDGELKGEIDYKLRSKEIQMGRRLFSQSGKGFKATDRVNFRRHLIRINGKNYRLGLCIVDSSAVHGMASYKDFCANTGIELDSKDLLDGKKSQMISAYFENGEVFDKYAIGDLRVYDALKSNSDLVFGIYENLGIQDYFEEPKLTIGATTKNLLLASIAKHFNHEKPNELIDIINVQARATYLRDNVNNTYSLLSKVRGGRCRNNRPTHTELKGVLCDIDISGCYGSGQRNQLYPFGRPIIEGLELGEDNKYETLGDWYKTRKNELVDGAWSAIISNRYLGDKKIPIEKRTEYERLEHPQDFFESWFDFSKKDIQEYESDTSQIEDIIVDTKTGGSKIFNHQIINGMLTSDGLDWILNVSSTRQRKELLDKLIIVSAIYYPKSELVESPEKLLETIENFESNNQQAIKIEKGKSRKLTLEQNCHAWYGVNIGELLIDELLINRARYPKKPEKHPLNELYKLFTNSDYGILVSPFFTISNVVVGNNITARARVLCWAMEKGLYGFQSITDGCTFDLNNVVHASKNRRVTASNLANIHHTKKLQTERQIKLAPLGEKEWSILQWNITKNEKGKTKVDATIKHGEKILKLKEATDLIDNLAWKHLQSLFNLKVLHAASTLLKVDADTQTHELKSVERIPQIGQFSFETKSIYSSGKWQGSANYMLWQGDYLANSKMRAYTDKPHESIIFTEGDKWKLTDTFKSKSPAKTFLENLSSQDEIERQNIFIKQGILKPSEYLQRYETLSKANVFPGDNIYNVGIIRECSLSQFTFKDLEQFKSVKKEYEGNKRRYAQSYEMFFSSDNGNILDYQNMIENIDYAITYLGLSKLNGYLGDLGNGWLKNHHPMAESLLKARQLIYASPDELDTVDWFDEEMEPLEENQVTESVAYEGEIDW